MCKKYMTKEERLEGRRMTLQKYNNSAKGRASRAKYRKTLKGKVADSKYRKSNKGKAVALKASRKFNKTETRKASNKRYRLSEKGKAYTRKWNLIRKKLKGRLVKFHTEKEWRECLERYGNRCAKCGVRQQLTRDHIIPLSKEGGDEIENIQPLCISCNSSKNAFTMVTYLPSSYFG